MAKTSKPLIQFKNIFLQFKNKQILENFNLEIFPQDKIVVTGPSGIGKSSLFNLLLGLKQAQSGEIFFKNKKITAKNIQDLRSQIAYLDQDVSLGSDRVRNLIDDYFSFKVNQDKKITPKKLEKLFAEFFLDLDTLDKHINQLSGGEKQRLGLIIALLLDRPILLLDEVDSALDKDLVDQVINHIMQLKTKTVILIAHNQAWQKNKNIRSYNFKDQQWQ